MNTTSDRNLHCLWYSTIENDEVQRATLKILAHGANAEFARKDIKTKSDIKFLPRNEDIFTYLEQLGTRALPCVKVETFVLHYSLVCFGL
ncbi:hypothetical protein Bpfe_019077 [Biomphalaria pfeifferi]|uniref:Uncharacterized protein n=1 Tax=Biomphalaria pfeifferi TaxID=112525 RepID=A0AAD8F5L9_BIOPF|nr:hypothetical protein Bpfe_019077 [Biomphalaria pfeifferi]